MSIQNTEQFVVAIRRKLDDKIAGFLKRHFSLGDGSTCIQTANTFQEAARFDRNYMLPIDRNTQVLFGHLQDNLQEHYNISITPIDKENGAPDFFDREYFNGKYPISRGEWQHYFSKLAEECEDIRRPQENDTFYYKAEAEDTIWDEQGNYKPNFIYKPTGFRMVWYKYPLRSCYANRDISFDEFEKMVDACVKSLKTQPLKECNIRY